MERKTNSRTLREGDKLSRISYMEVVSNRNGSLFVRNEDGLEWSIASDIVEKECYSTQYDTVKEVTRTEMAEILMHSRDSIIKVNFNKQATADSVIEAIDTLLEKSPKLKFTKKGMELLLMGAERTLIGYVIATEPVLGRTIVIDMEIEKDKDATWDNRQRQVDHRTLNYLIVKNVKYVLKKK